MPLQFAVIAIGAWHSGPTLEIDAKDLRSMIETNVVAHIALSRALLERLPARGGGILHVGSLAAFLPVPWFSHYGASKAYELSLVMALRQEMSGRGVAISLLAPGLVATEFLPRPSSALWRAIVDVLASSPETVAHAAYGGLRSNRPVIVPGLFWRLLWFGIRIVPAPLLAILTRILLGPMAPARNGAAS
jgi:hypothetical protein